MSSDKIKNIEFLRVIGCIAIIMYHLCAMRLGLLFDDISLYNDFYNMTLNGNKAVDLFFILSGVFFAIKLDVTKSLWGFFKNKIIRFYPVLLFITLIYFIVSLFLPIKFYLYDNILAILGFNGIGLSLNKGNLSIFWYVASLLWVLGIYFYMFKYFQKKYVNLVIFCIVLFCYIFLIHIPSKDFGILDTSAYVFNVAFMRGLAGIGLGYFIGEWYRNNLEKIKTIVLPIYSKLGITLLEFVCLFFIINNLMLHRLKYNNQIIFIVAFAVIIVLFLLRQGFISKVLEHDIWVRLSAYTYSLYMTHSLLMNIIKETVWKQYPEWVHLHPIVNIAGTFILAVIFGIFTYYVVEKPCVQYFKRRLHPKAAVEVK